MAVSLKATQFVQTVISFYCIIKFIFIQQKTSTSIGGERKRKCTLSLMNAALFFCSAGVQTPAERR